MATQVKHPIWLPALGSPGAGTFASLYAIESFARALLSSVVPIQAYDLLRSEQKVSLLYTCVSVFALLITLTTPLLLRTFARRWVYSMGAALLIAAAAALATHTLTGQVIGQLCRSAGAGALALGLNLYIMDHIHKTKFMQSESLRMAWSTLGWTIGPAAGVALYTRLGLAAPYAASAVCSIALLALFWFYRLSENTAIRAGGKAKQEVNPLRSVGRFLSQPRLRLAWLSPSGARASGAPSSSTGRSSWWCRGRAALPAASWSRRATRCCSARFSGAGSAAVSAPAASCRWPSPA